MSSELRFERNTPLPASPDEVFAWHARPGAFERLVPPWQRVDRAGSDTGLANGARREFRVHAGPVAFRWVAEHQDVEPGRGFTDIQAVGPFERWVHRHRFEPAPGGSILHDRIDCELPLGLRAGRSWVRRNVTRFLAYRHAVTAADLAMHAGAAGRPRLRVAVTGASGLIGSLLIPALTAGGHEVIRIVRRTPGPGEIRWDPAGAGLDPAALRGIDAVVHLAGESIAAARWTAARKRAIRESRKSGSRLLAEAIAKAPGGPRVLVSASAIGFYGNRGDEELTESSPAGAGFLAEVSQAWEAAAEPARVAGARVACIRIGLVLTPAGGLLQRLLLPFRLGIAGRLGSGRQWMSWISADDLVGVFHHALTNESVDGAANAVAPGAVRNAEFTATLGKILHRPTPFPVPRIALRLALGEIADDGILASTLVRPAALESTGYRFRHSTLDAALAHELGVGP